MAAQIAIVTFNLMSAPQPGISAASHIAAFLGPIFPAWNYSLLEHLFRLFPHTDPRMNFAEFFIYNPLISDWPFAAAFYLAWRATDEKTGWRRGRLIEIIVACIGATVVSLALRPWLGAPAPSHHPDFEALFPRYLWRFGNENSFPSHSTLIYFLVAAGIWPMARKWSAALTIWVLLAISLPRIYMGGHYPTDVLSSILLAFVFLWITHRAAPFARSVIGRIASGGMWIEAILFLWLFELAEGFHSTGDILQALWHFIAKTG
jgi:undecaprenyl-diphosphatase